LDSQLPEFRDDGVSARQFRKRSIRVIVQVLFDAPARHDEIMLRARASRRLR
jgi:hypothetical protein